MCMQRTVTNIHMHVNSSWLKNVGAERLYDMALLTYGFTDMNYHAPFLTIKTHA